MDEQASKNPKIVMIAGPKGGVGKTTIALNTSILLAKLKKRILLVDCDYSTTSASILCGKDYHIDYEDIHLGPDFIDDIKRNLANNVDIIPSPIFKPGDEDMIFNYSHRLLTEIRNQKEYDFCLIDTAPGYSRSHIFFAGESDSILLISTPEPPAISASYSFLKLISENGLHSNIHLLVNQASNHGEGIDVFHRFAVAVSYFLERSLDHIGSIPEDDMVVTASKDETPLVLRFPNSMASNAIDDIAYKLAS
ncbi:MAG: MinD/ParA family protein [Candidatus Zixiibacteriota bacterium]